jgi:hypothetical protein
MKGSSDNSMFFIIYIALAICYFHGIYLAFQEGFVSFLVAAVIAPWGMLKGFIGFF